jgi:hypothetical protein
MRSKKFLLFAVVAAFTIATLPVAAQNPTQLTGVYAATGSASCLISMPASPSTPPFYPNLTPTPGATVYAESLDLHALYTFKADGTGIVEGSEIALTYPPGYANASRSQFSGSFTYTVGKNGVLTLDFGTLTGIFGAGPFTGLTYTVAPYPAASGRIGQNGTLVLASAAPIVETLQFTIPLNPPLVIVVPRICHRTRVLVPVD